VLACKSTIGMEDHAPGREWPGTVKAGAKVPRRLTGRVIREAFGGTNYPPTKHWIEPLVKRGDWWSSVTDYYACIMKGRSGRRAFGRGVAFVMIGDSPLDGEFRNGGCNFPRLGLGITEAGSLVGVWSSVVHT